MAKGKTAELQAWIARERPERIGGAEWEVLRTMLAPVSESYLRKLLRGSGVALAPLIEGVRQESFDALEASLSALLEEYERGDTVRRAAVRRLVIAAKDHARWASRKEDRRAEKRRNDAVDADLAGEPAAVSRLGSAAAERAVKAPAKLLDLEGLMNYSARALSARALSLNELRTRLKRRASKQEDVAEAISRLKDAGFLDDKRFADTFANLRRENQGLGKTKVVHDLMARRVAPEVAQKAVERAYAGADEIAMIESFLTRKYRGKDLGELLREEKHLASAYRKLRTAGFSSGNSIKVLKRHAARLAEDVERLDEMENAE